jgi:hypothetical protein
MSMTAEKTKEALTNLAAICRKHDAMTPHRLDGSCVCRCDLTTIFGPGRRVTTHQLNHLLFMVIEAQKLVDENRTAKSMRWLGFVQGALWGLGLVSIDNMKELNRTDEHSGAK